MSVLERPDPTAPYDALLLVSFGGPEQPGDVLPFLRNVTTGKDIPDDRLREVGAHYDLFGGRSPINDQNRAFIAALEAELASRGVDLPVYWGNRNWDPLLPEAVSRMAADGVRRAACFLTSVYSSYSGCRQYRENLADAGTGRSDAPRLDRLRLPFNHPGFVTANADAVRDALDRLPEALRPEARLVFVTHSIPTAMDAAAGAAGHAYVDQHRDVIDGVLAALGEPDRAADLVFCSRSGPPRVPWLEPDVNDHLEGLAAEGVQAVVVAPIGFVSDHMEVRYDLDTEAAETGRRLGLAFERAATAGTHPAFVAAVVDLLLERAAVERGEQPERARVGGLPVNPDVCVAGCCPNPRAPDRLALGGAD